MKTLLLSNNKSKHVHFVKVKASRLSTFRSHHLFYQCSKLYHSYSTVATRHHFPVYCVYFICPLGELFPYFYICIQLRTCLESYCLNLCKIWNSFLSMQNFYHTGTGLTAAPKLGLRSFTRAATNLLLRVQLPLKIWPHVFIISAPSELSNGSKTFFFFSVLLGSFAFATNLVFTFINCFINQVSDQSRSSLGGENAFWRLCAAAVCRNKKEKAASLGSDLTHNFLWRAC